LEEFFNPFARVKQWHSNNKPFWISEFFDSKN